MELEALLRDQVGRATGRSWLNAPIQPLKGDASQRAYYRVGNAPDSHVVMVMPPGTTLVSEEVVSGPPPTELPFLDVQRYLAGLGVRVPKISRYDEAASVLVLEDLGDTTFEGALQNGIERELLYGRATDALAELRARAEARPEPTSIAFKRHFDAGLYEWELHHFREFGLEAWSGKQPTSAERAELDRHFAELARTLAAAPKGFTHRDYQSRNIMVLGDSLVMIDFQDALQAPRQYDLVALLRDSYVELVPALVDRMLDRYIQSFERASGQRIEVAPFKVFFDLLTVQRKLKDAGRFEFIHRVKRNPGFLSAIPASLRYVRAALDRLPQLGLLREILVRYVPQLG